MNIEMMQQIITMVGNEFQGIVDATARLELRTFQVNWFANGMF